MDESRLSLKDLLEDAKLKDYIVNSFLPLAPNATLADAKDLQCGNDLTTSRYRSLLELSRARTRVPRL